MSPENKQRIVGIVVLVAFIALLIPFLFTSGIRKKLSSDKMPIDDEKRQLIAEQIENIDSVDFVETPLAESPDGETQKSTPAIMSTDQVEQTDILVPEGNQYELQTVDEDKPSSVVASDATTEFVESVEVVSPPPPVKTVSKKEVIKNPVVAKSTKSIKEKSKVVVGKNANDYWSVQVGSFSDQSRIKNLIDELHAKGFQVYMQKITTSDDASLTRVLVGHENSKDKAKQIYDQLESKMRIKGLIVKNKNQ